VAQEYTEFIPAPSEDDREMNDALSDYLSGSSDKITKIARDSISQDGETTYGWQVTSVVD
jgi:hypothetical protein